MLQADGGKIKNPRGRGLMLGADLAMDDATDSRVAYRRLSVDAMEKGLIIQGTNAGRVLRFLPNYLISEDEIRHAIKVLKEVV